MESPPSQSIAINISENAFSDETPWAGYSASLEESSNSEAQNESMNCQVQDIHNMNIEDTELQQMIQIEVSKSTTQEVLNFFEEENKLSIDTQEDGDGPFLNRETASFENENTSLNGIEFDEFYKSQEPGSEKKWSFNDMYIRSNSPMVSNYNSDVDMDIDVQMYETESPIRKQTPNNRMVKTYRNISYDENDIQLSLSAEENPRIPTTTTLFANTYVRKYKKFTYEDIEKSLSQYYHKTENNFTEIDLLITYLSGMRSIYVISRHITQLKSYSIAMTTISITICLAVIAPFVKEKFWGAYLISTGNALATILITLSRYLKYDSNSAQYAFMAKQFNKLEMRAEYENAIEPPSSQKIHDIESTIMEMSEYIQELIPEETVKLFPLIYRTNIMQFIKKTELYRKNLIIRFRDIKNEIHYILYKWNLDGDELEKIDTTYKSKTPQQERETNRILYLMSLKEKTKRDLMQCKNIYKQIDELFKKEIRYAETHQSCFGCSGVFKPDYELSKLNPVVSDYLRLIMPE